MVATLITNNSLVRSTTIDPKSEQCKPELSTRKAPASKSRWSNFWSRFQASKKTSDTSSDEISIASCAGIGVKKAFGNDYVSRSSRSVVSCPAAVLSWQGVPQLHEIKRTVRFSASNDERTIPSLRKLSRKEIAATWYSAEERKRMKTDARNCAQNAKHSRSVVSNINEVYEVTRFLGIIATKEMDHEDLLQKSVAMTTYAKCVDQRSLMCLKDSHRGLEDSIIDTRLRNEQEEVVRTSHSAVAEQSITSSRSEAGGSRRQRSSKPRPLQEVKLSMIYQDITRPSAMLARVMGEADLLAAAKAWGTTVEEYVKSC